MSSASHDRRDLTGPFDVVGDVHGCFAELQKLVRKLGYGEQGTHPQGRRLIFAGDLIDRGPASLPALEWVLDRVDDGRALLVASNHDDKLRRWLLGNPVTISGGLETTIAEFEARSDREALRARLIESLSAVPTYLWLDGGALLVAHAGLTRDLHGRADRKTRARCLYGSTTGARIDGYPERIDWAANHSGPTAVVYGHTAVSAAVWRNNTANIDLGCVFGGSLCAVRWPERSFVQVRAAQASWPLGGERRNLPAPHEAGTAPLQDAP